MTKKPMRPTTIRVRPIDDEAAAAVIGAGFARDFAGAIRFSLALARRWASEKKAGT